MSRKYSYAQHFLRSPRFAMELIGHSNIRKNDTVVDLGAGSGVIASVLARRCKSVIAIENEAMALAKLRRNMRLFDNVHIINGDIMTADLPVDDYKVFSNIPFSYSSDIVRRLTGHANPPKSIYLIVQKQFANKLVSSNRQFTSQLGAELMPWWQVRIRKPLRRNDFTPPPAVDTVLLEIKPLPHSLLPEEDRVAYRQFVASCFGRQKVFASLPRAAAGINTERKPSELTVAQWVELYRLTNHSA